jgi:hypothetical protein
MLFYGGHKGQALFHSNATWRAVTAASWLHLLYKEGAGKVCTRRGWGRYVQGGGREGMYVADG